MRIRLMYREKVKGQADFWLILGVVLGVLLLIKTSSLITDLFVTQPAAGAKVAWPQFGSVCCELSGHWGTVNKELIPHPTFKKGRYTLYECVNEECELRLPTTVCSEGNAFYAVWLNNICQGTNHGDIFYSQGCTGPVLNFPVKFYSGDTLKVMTTCVDWFWGQSLPTSSSVSIKVSEQKLYYYFNGARVDQERSEGCQRNDVISNYLDEQPKESTKTVWTKLKQYLPVTWLKGGTDENVNSLYDLPATLQAGDCYLFLYRWEEVPSLNLVAYDSTSDGIGDTYVYCDMYTKEVYNWEEIIAVSGDKYYVPTTKVTIANRPRPCCRPEDCLPSWTCNIKTFSCEEKYQGNPCNSVFDCGAEYTSGEVCEYKNGQYIRTIWGCDFTKPQTSYKGTCVLSREEVVKCCKFSCAGDEYCNFEEGCKKQIVLLPCGAYGEYCCKEGGDYKVQQCPSDLKCCYQIGSDFRGVCKDTCDPVLICDGDGKCEPEKGETSENCPSDCEPLPPSECYVVCNEDNPYPWQFIGKQSCYLSCWWGDNQWTIMIGLVAIILLIFVLAREGVIRR